MDLVNEYTSSEEDIEEGPEPALVDISIYLLNYSEQKNMSGLFLYLLWRPSPPMMSKLKQASKEIIRHIESNLPEVKNNYNWNSVGTPPKSLYGKYSVTNVSLLASPHITMFPNIRGETYKVQRFLENVSNAIKNIKIPPQLIKFDDAELKRRENLNKMLFKSSSSNSDSILSPCKFVSFRLLPKLSVFTSNTSKNVFIAAKIDLSSPESELFFSTLKQIIRENVELLDLTVDGSLDKNDYHVSLVMGEFKGLSSRRKDVSVLRNSFLRLDFSNLLQDLRINVNSFYINQLGSTRKTIEVPLNTDA